MDKMDWEKIPYFLAVVRAGSLRGAADAMGATHGTLSRHIRALEASYDVQLFNRSKSGLSLTPAGQKLLPIAQEAETLFRAARRELQGLDREETGLVRVSVPPPLAYQIMPDILAEFSVAYPGVDLEIHATYDFEDIERLETDVSIRVAHEVTEDVTGRKLYPIGVGTYASRSYLDHNFAHAGPLGEGLHWIGSRDVSYFPGHIEASPFPHAEQHHVIDDYLMQMNLVRAGYGMALLPVYCEELFPSLVPVPGTRPTLDRNIWILLHSDLRRTTRVRRFVDFVVQKLIALRPVMQGNAV